MSLLDAFETEIAEREDGSAFDGLFGAPKFWGDGSDASTLYDATSGGSLVDPDGIVRRINDKSGFGHHMVESGAGTRPVRKTAQQNGRDAVLFAGARLQSATIPATTQQYTLIAVCKITGSGSPIYNGDSGAGGYGIYNNAGTLSVLHGGIAFNSDGATTTNWEIIIVRKGAGSLYMERNGSPVTIGTSTPNTPSSIASMGIDSFGGLTGECFIFEGAISDPVMEYYRDGLNEKWAIF